MRIGVVIPSFGPYADPGLVDDLVDAAEDLGYDSAWFADHVVIPEYARTIYSPAILEPVACCLRGLARTSRLRFGTDVLVAPYRQPVVLAAQAGTAAAAAPGRLLLGLGVGFLRDEFEAVGAPPYAERGAATDEYLEVLGLLRDSEGPVSFQGRYVRFDRIHAEPRPTGVPFLVGGNADVALRRAARLGDGWHPLWPAPDDYAAARERILAVRAEAGGTGPFTFSYSAPLTEVCDEPPPPAPAPRRGGAQGEHADEFAYVRPVPQRGDGSPMFRGTPEQLRADLEALEAAGVDQVVVRFWVTGGLGPDALVEQMRRCAAEVVAQLGSSNA